MEPPVGYATDPSTHRGDGVSLVRGSRGARGQAPAGVRRSGPAAGARRRASVAAAAPRCRARAAGHPRRRAPPAVGRRASTSCCAAVTSVLLEAAHADVVDLDQPPDAPRTKSGSITSEFIPAPAGRTPRRGRPSRRRTTSSAPRAVLDHGLGEREVVDEIRRLVAEVDVAQSVGGDVVQPGALAPGDDRRRWR